jgi:murein DD-endopeptidase MepM/ murein hydrolase activator NlpD
MRGLSRRLNHSLASLFREKRLFLQTEGGTTHIRLTPLAQLGLVAGGCATLGWLAFATAHVALDQIGRDAMRGGIAVLDDAAEARIAALAEERDLRAAEALSAQNRFRIAMDRIARQQSEILRVVEEKRELDLALGVLRARLSDAARQRDLARAEAEALRGQIAEVSEAVATSGASDLAATLETVAAALQEAVRVRDAAIGEREALAARLSAAESELAALTERNEAMIAELEYAVRTSFAPLEALFEAADLDLDHVLATVRRDHAGTGGGEEGEAALRATVRMSTRSYAPETIDPLERRFDELLVDLDRMNLLRIAAGRIPYAMPVKADHRFTSGFGYRRDPKNGRRRMHSGIDLAAPQGTPIYATADGVVTSAGSERGYGKTVRIRHDFGYETLYAHKSNIRVEVGQRVSRGDHIGDMGATGRATGVHLHYEVRLNGRPVNPMVYLEAARDVF